ncbi:MAG: hypothetical protein ACI4SM_00460 [Candidatus Gastranaerophilaceae bacterium]
MNIQAIGAVAPQKVQPQFTGLSDTIAKGLGKVGNSDAFVKGMEKIGNSKNLMVHLSTASSAVTSGLYIYKNLTDSKKTKNEKITSALNQALTFGISTALTYGVSKALGKVSANICDKFANAISAKGYDAAKNAALKAGAKNAIDLVVCSSINRFFVPVAVTPIANKLGVKVCEALDKRDAAKAAKGMNA